MKRLSLVLAVLALLGMGGVAQADPLTDVWTSVAMVPSALNVAQGSTVDVSVYMTLPYDITMSAISSSILYERDVFTDDALGPVTNGPLLKHDWVLDGGAPLPGGEWRVGGIDWDFSGEFFTAGSGKLFTFTLKVKADAELGSCGLTWGAYDGHDNNTCGFDYGDADFQDVLLLDSNMHGTSINVVSEISEVPEPSSIIVMLCGLGSLVAFRRRRT